MSIISEVCLNKAALCYNSVSALAALCNLLVIQLVYDPLTCMELQGSFW